MLCTWRRWFIFSITVRYKSFISLSICFNVLSIGRSVVMDVSAMKWSFMYCLLFIILIMKDSDSKAVKKGKTTKVPHTCQGLPKMIKSCQKKSKKGTKNCKKLPSLKKDCKRITENKTGKKGTSVQIFVIDIWRTHFLFCSSNHREWRREHSMVQEG